jgi:glyoxylase-like metal-dependent hydrolase (beta-lactamase superfamily II)
MKPRFWILPLVAASVAACTTATPEQQMVYDAADALGGRDRILAIRTLEMEGGGTNGNLGQDMTMEATGQQFMVTAYRRVLDLPNRRARTEQTRTPNFPYFQGQQPQSTTTGIDAEIAYAIAANGNATRAADAVARDRALEFYHHPIAIVRAALDPAAQLSNLHTAGSERVVDVTTVSGRSLTLALDATTHLPTRVVSMTDNLNLGDVAIETSFADYSDVDGLRLPARYTTRTDRYTTADIRIERYSVDGDTGDLAAPSAAASAAPTTGPPPPNVVVTDVAPGLWLLGGQSHHSVLVELSDHLMLIEAPQNDTRTLAVVAKARELVPAKPLTTLVNSHHHFDHSGGIRAAMAEGLTVIAHKASAEYFRQAAGRPHTLVPDALEKSKRPVTIDVVDDAMTIKDGSRVIELYHIAGNPHADTLLMAYFPRERVLVEADVYTPGSAAQPFAANLLENIQKRKLRVDRIVPLHGQIAPFADLVKTVEAAKAVPR